MSTLAIKNLVQLKRSFMQDIQDTGTLFQRSHQFRGVKSEGGIISTKRRIVDENWFRDVWLRYDEKLNKEYNSENNLWEKYQQPFIKKKDKGW